MPVYDGLGAELSAVYDGYGNEINFAYDGEGNQIYQKAPLDLKVMQYNTGNWYIGSGTNVPSDKEAEYYALQNGIIQSESADILCLNEYWNQFSANRTALSLLNQYYPYIEIRDGDTQYYGHAICSKYPIESYVTNAYSTDLRRYYDKALINVNGKRINVICTHLSPSSHTLREVEARELFDYAETLDNFIICGDFNIPVTSVTDSEYIAEYKQFVDAGCHLANGGNFGFMVTCSDEPTGTWTGCIDNIITSANINITDAYVDTTKLTDAIADKVDHMPVIAELVIY